MWQRLVNNFSQNFSRNAKRVEERIKNMLPAHSLKAVLNLEHIKEPPVRRELFNFRNPTTVSQWSLLTDQMMINGKSSASFDFDDQLPLNLNQRDEELVHQSKLRKTTKAAMKKLDLEAFLSTSETTSPTKEKESQKVKIEIPKTGSARFSGILDLTVSKDIEKSGFVCLRSNKFVPRLNLERYDALEMRIQTDGRLYCAQIKTETTLDDDLYQVIIPPLTPGKWIRVILPFEEFLLTWRGYVEEEQRPLEPNRIRHIAFLMAERENGPFCMNIDWICAVRLVDESARLINGESVQTDFFRRGKSARVIE